jgi:POT family proton-dependent oligopeptide transporter
MSNGTAAAEERTLLGHPPALYVLFFAELWERFCFYGMRALLVLYMASKVVEAEGKAPGFGYEDGRAYAIYGAYGTLVYAFPLVGGWLADRFLGYRRAVITGALFMAVGEFLLVVYDEQLFFLGLGALCVGNGFFKPNISSMVGKLYPQGDPRRDRGFTIFYMGINIGALLSPLACGYVGETYGWSYGFGLAGLGILTGLAGFVWGQKLLGEVGAPPTPTILSERGAVGLPNGLTIVAGAALAVPIAAYVLFESSLAKILLYVLGIAFLIPMLRSTFQADRVQRDRTLVYFVLWIFHTAFWMLFEQAGSSLTLFAERNVDRVFEGIQAPDGGGAWTFPTSWFQSVNPFFIVALAPLFTLLWTGLQKLKADPSIPLKFALGVIQLGLGYAVLVWGARHFSQEGLTPFVFLVLMYLLHTTGELCLSPVGLSAVTKLAPEKSVGFFMGFWFLSISFAHNLAAMIAGETAADASTPAQETLDVYAGVYWQGALFLLGMGVFLALVARWINKLAHGVR